VKIGCVIRPDIDRLGQAKPGDPIRFTKVTAYEAAAIYKEDLSKTTEEHVVKG
jgi:allophanate hydrolase subunit 2